MLETLLRGLLTGVLVGLSIGPVAIWGARVRRQNYNHALVIAAGASLGEIVLGASIITLVGWYDVPLEAIRAVLEQLTDPSLFVVGVVLIIMASCETGGSTWSESRRFVGAFALTVFRPDVVGLVAYYLVRLWAPADNLWLFFPAFALGTAGIWLGNIEFFYRLRERSGVWIRIIGVACMLWAIIGFVTPVQAF